jgi:hypothetical protein
MDERIIEAHFADDSQQIDPEVRSHSPIPDIMKDRDPRHMKFFPTIRENAGKWVPFCVITLAGCLLHGLILLNERPFWDGLLIFHLLRTGNWPELYRWFSELGGPLAACIHYLIGGWTSHPILSYRIAALLPLLICAWMFYGLCRFWGLTRITGMQLAVLSQAYPAYQMSEEIIMVPGNIVVCLFYVSAFLAFYGSRLRGAWSRIVRWGSLSGFLVSFFQESLLPVYLGFFCFFVFSIVMREEDIPRSRSLKFFIKTAFRNFDYLILPFVYIVLKQYFFHPYGGYAIYNSVCMSPRAVLYNGFVSVNNAIIYYLDNAVLFYRPSQIVVVLCVSAFIYDRIKTPESPGNQEQRRSAWILLGTGCVFWFLGVAAYVLAQKPPLTAGIGTRCSILLEIPTSLMILGGLRLWISPKYRTAVYLLLLLAFSVETWRSHLDWQGRTVKDLAILRCLRKTPPPADSSLVVVEDNLPMICKRGNEILRIYDENRYFEWAVLFQEASPDRIRFGVPATWTDQEFLDFLATRRRWPQYGFVDWQPEGKVYRMKITYLAPDWGSEKLTEWNPCGVGWRYLILKLTRPLERQNEFLDSLLKIEFLDEEAHKTSLLSIPTGLTEQSGTREDSEGRVE